MIPAHRLGLCITSPTSYTVQPVVRSDEQVNHACLDK